MSSATLVSTTCTDVRPLAWGGTPLHRHQAQIRAVVRRRLGERHFQLLSEPQPHDNDNIIDWYSSRSGTLQPLSTLPPDRRGRARTDIAALLHDIDQLGQSMEGGATEDCRLAGRLLRFAVYGPTDDHLFMIDDQPVMACWGYDFQGIGLMPAAPVAPSTAIAAPIAADPESAPEGATAVPAPVEAPPPAATPPEASATAAPVEPPAAPKQEEKKRRRFGWLLWLLLALLGLAALLALLVVVLQIEAPASSRDAGEVRTTGVAPSVSQPPQGLLACSAARSSGGGGFTSGRHYLGDKPGLVKIRYDMAQQPDEMRVYYRGRLVATTGKPVAGPGSLEFQYQPDAGYYTVVVEIIGNSDTTTWAYNLGCPR